MMKDNEQNDYLLILINNSEVYLFKSKHDSETNMILWKEDDIVFKISSKIRCRSINLNCE